MILSGNQAWRISVLFLSLIENFFLSFFTSFRSLIMESSFLFFSLFSFFLSFHFFLNVNYFCLISTKFLQQEDFIYAPSHSLSVHVTMSRNIVQHQWKTLYVADLEVHDNVFPCMYLEWNYSSISFFFFFLTCLLFWILFLTSFVLEMFLPFVPNISGEGV